MGLLTKIVLSLLFVSFPLLVNCDETIVTYSFSCSIGDSCFSCKNIRILTNCSCSSESVGDGICVEECNTPSCLYDGGDCGNPPGCDCPGGLIGNGNCDPECDSSACLADLQDCDTPCLFCDSECVSSLQYCGVECAGDEIPIDPANYAAFLAPMVIVLFLCFVCAVARRRYNHNNGFCIPRSSRTHRAAVNQRITVTGPTNARKQTTSTPPQPPVNFPSSQQSRASPPGYYPSRQRSSPSQQEDECQLPPYPTQPPAADQQEGNSPQPNPPYPPPPDYNYPADAANNPPSYPGPPDDTNH